MRNTALPSTRLQLPSSFKRQMSFSTAFCHAHLCESMCEGVCVHLYVCSLRSRPCQPHTFNQHLLLTSSSCHKMLYCILLCYITPVCPPDRRSSSSSSSCHCLAVSLCRLQVLAVVLPANPQYIKTRTQSWFP